MQSEHTFGSGTRKRAFLAIAAAIFTAFTARLAQLELVEGTKYRSRSEAQGIKQNVIEPIRGTIYDRYNHPIVANVPSYSVLVTPNKITPRTKVILANILGTDTATLNDRIRQYKINDYSPVRIWRDLDHKAWVELNEDHLELEGVDIGEDTKRAYAPDIRASHILGYTKEISKDEITKLGDYYDPGDVVGKSGLENTYESFLRGVKGYEFAAVNNRGQRVNAFNNGRNDLRPINGFDLYLGLDGGMQQYAEQLLQGYHGAVVAIDPDNGEILAMASAPDYDPNVFSGVTSKEQYDKLHNDPSNPLLNRATQAAYPPGSTWKPLMSIAGLMEGLIKPATTVNCPGSYTYGGHTWRCDGVHGTLAVRRAIQASCDVFFYRLGVDMGIDTYNRYGRMFHFGEKLGADVFEGYTSLPSHPYYDKLFGKDKWPKGVMVNLGIGQGELLVNPLQLASYCATLSTGGIYHQPHLVRSNRNNQLGTVEMFKYESEDLHLPHDVMEIVQGGMFDVVNVPGGTAGNAKLDDIVIAGKTGTAQAGKGRKDHSWFICYAPFDHPKIAMCVLVENSGFGSQFAAPIARKLVRYYFTRQHEAGDELPSAPSDGNGLPSVSAPDSSIRHAMGPASHPDTPRHPAAQPRHRG